MTDKEFNDKWVSHLEERHYGMALEDSKYIEFVDKIFEKLSKSHPSFTYSQIKWKFGMSRVYLENVPISVINEIEVGLNQLYEKTRN